MLELNETWKKTKYSYLYGKDGNVMTCNIKVHI